MVNDSVRNLLINAEVYETEVVQPDQEGNVPDGTFKKDGFYYRINNKELTEYEIQIALLAKQTMYIKTIKNIVKYFLILSIISLICAFILQFI